MDQQKPIGEYISAVKRRLPIALVVAIVGIILAATIAYKLPPVYRSAALILVESQRIPSQIAQTTVTADAAERIQTIRQRIMTRDNLLSIAREFSLFPSDSNQYSPTEIVEMMRETVRIRSQQTVNSGGRRNSDRILTFTVSFEHQSRPATTRVVNKLVELILDQNLTSRSRLANDTRAFIEEQIRTKSAQLRELDAKIIDFKRVNNDSLPASQSFQQQLLLNYRNEVTQIDTKLQSLDQEKRILALRAETGVEILKNDSVRVLSPKEQQIARLESDLLQIEVTFSENHPRVRSVKSQIEALKASMENTNGDEASGENSTTITNASDEVAIKMALIDEQIATLEQRKDSLNVNLANVREALSKVPETQNVLEAMLSERSILQNGIRVLQTKRGVAETGQKLEEDRQSERFEIIEQAKIPSEPIKPNRLLVLAGGSGLSLGLSLGLIILLELLDQRVYSSSALRRRFQAEPIVAIPYIEIASERRQKKRKAKLIALLAIVASIVLVAAIHFYIINLQLLFQKILDLF